MSALLCMISNGMRFRFFIRRLRLRISLLMYVVESQVKIASNPMSFIHVLSVYLFVCLSVCLIIYLILLENEFRLIQHE